MSDAAVSFSALDLPDIKQHSLRPDRVGMLRAGGFSDDEIAGWAARTRPVLTNAGFTEPEISTYFGEQPRPVSGPFFDRMVQGAVESQASQLSLIDEAYRGAVRAGTAPLFAIEDVANRIEMWLYQKTGNEEFKQAAEQDIAALETRRAKVAQENAPGVASVTDVTGASDAAHYIFSKVGEAIPTVAGYVAAGVPRMVILGALQGALRASDQTGGDKKATVAGAAIGAALAGAPAPFLNGAFGKSMVSDIAAGMAGMAIVGGAQPFAEQIPQSIAAGQYVPPSGEQVLEGAAAGAIGGALIGGVGGLRRREQTATGDLYESKIGGIPEPDAFRNAATAIAGPNAAPAVTRKLQQLYDERGIHPAEVAHDAARDVTISQDLLTGGKLPEAYVGKQPLNQPQPGAPPVGLSLGAPRPELTPAEEKVLSHISVGEGNRRPPWRWSDVYRDWWDNLNAIPDRELDGSLTKTSENPYRLERLLRGDAGIARHWIEFGQLDYNTKDKIGPSLQEILKPVADNLDPLRAFANSVRAIELENRGIDTGFDRDAIHETADAGVNKYGPMFAEMVQYQNNLAKYLKDSGVLSEKGYSDMLDLNRAYIPFNVVFDEQPPPVGGGKSTQPVNPIKRIEGSERQKIDPVESILKNTYVLVSQAERNRAKLALVNLMERNKAAAQKVETTIDAETTSAINDLLKSHGLDKSLFDFLSGAVPPREGQIRVFRNGKPETWEVGADIANAIKGLDARSAGWLAQWLTSENRSQRLLAQGIVGPAKMLRAGATTLSPDFALRNPVKDYFSAFLYSEKPVYTPWDSIKGLLSASVKDAYFQKWLSAGGGNSELVALDRRYMQESLSKLTQQTGISTRAWNVIGHPFRTTYEVMRKISELGEQATRLGEFRYVYDREIKNGATPADAARTAAYASREITLDFARRGAVTQSMNLATAFFNAQIQGPDRLARAIRDNPLRTGLRIAAGITIPSILAWWLGKDDPRVQELPSWQRDMFLVLPTDHWQDFGPAPRKAADSETPFSYGGTAARYRNGRMEINNGWIFRIPRGYESGIIFGAAVERLLDAYVKDVPHAWDGLVNSIISSLIPGIVPTGPLPVMQQYANRSWTDRSLVPQSLEGQLPEYQYTPYTTELTKALGGFMAAFPGMREYSIGHGPAAGVARAMTSPILIENYVRAWTGGGGMYVLQLADKALRSQGILPDPVKPADTLADIPIARAFAVRYPTASAESLQRFYDNYERNKIFYDTWTARMKEGDTEAAQIIQDAGGMQMFLQLKDVHDTISGHNKLIRDVYKNPQLSPEEKRQEIDKYLYAEIQLAQDANQMMESMNQATVKGSRTRH